MGHLIKVVGMDPSMSNFGICKASVDVDTLEMFIEDLVLIKTVGESKKGVAKNCDDLRRAQEVFAGMVAACEGRVLAIAEVPLGAASNYKNGILSAGLSVGVLAGCPIPLIPVFVDDVKKDLCGHKYACKEEMIETAMNRFPGAPWAMTKRGGKMVQVAGKNEHLADAVAVVNSGIKTSQFLQSIAMMRAMRA